MKKELIKVYCSDFFDIKINKEMFNNIEKMFDKFVLGIESKGLENDLDMFFDVMYLDIECELESWE